MPNIQNIPTTQYIGPKIVPHFANPSQWNINTEYDALSIVTDGGNTYWAKYNVPAGIDISNTEYWFLSAYPDAQIQAYRQEVLAYAQQVEGFSDEIADAVELAESVDSKLGAVPEGETVISYVDDSISESETTINARISEVEEAGENFRKLLDSKLTPLSEINFGVLSRHFCPEPLHGVQGFCVFEQNDQLYWAQSEFIDDNSTAELAFYNLTTHEKVSGVQAVFGHMHGMRFIDNKIYIDGSNDTNARYSIVNVANIYNPVVTQGLTNLPVSSHIERVSFKNSNEVFHIALNSGEVYLYNISENTDSYYTTLKFTNIRNYVEVQDFNYNEDTNTFTITTYSNSQILIFDSSTGDLLNIVHVPEFIRHTKISEMEGAQILDGVLYVNAAESVGGILRLAALYKYDYVHGELDTSFFIRSYLQNDGAIYVQCNVNNNTGTLINPKQNNFLLVSDIFNLMRSQKNNCQVRVHITSAEYDYPILFDNVDAWLTVPSGGCTIHNVIRQIGGHLVFSNSGAITFDGSKKTTSDTYAIRNTGGFISIGVPSLSGNVFEGQVQVDNGGTLFNSGTNQYTKANIVRSLAFVKDSTNIATSGAYIVTW